MIWAVVLGASTVTQAIAQSDWQGAQPSQSPRLLRMALARYRLVKQCHLPFEAFGPDQNDTVLLPIGKDDRVYSFVQEDSLSAISCYQRKNGKDRLIYSIDLKYQERRAKNVRRAAHFTNLLDFVTSESLEGNGRIWGNVIVSPISQFARKDLAVKRDYIQYTHTYFNDGVSVFLLSDLKVTASITPLVDYHYNVSQDPFTRAPMKPEEWFKKYGLPVTKRELLKMH